MTHHINRWLPAFAAAYLFLLPTNAATFAVSVAFACAGLSAVVVFISAWPNPATRIPLAGASILVPLGIWAAWSCLSLAWSLDPAYSRRQLAREVMDGLLAMLIFYVAARDAQSVRLLIGAALASFLCFALLAIGVDVATGSWDAGRWHHGVGAWSTWLVLIAPFMFALLAPPPAGFGGGVRLRAVGLLLLALIIVTARMTDNRIVWIALAIVFATASVVAALRWPQTFTRTPVRWMTPLAVLLLVLGLAFANVLEERARIAAQGSVVVSIEHDPRIVLWEHITARIAARPWTGYGFGRMILADELERELHDPLLSHAHNMFVSQWLQTGLVGMVALAAFLFALGARYLRFVRSRDDTLAFVGLAGLAVVAGFLAKNITDDFLFHSNAKELWAMTAFLLGYGTRRERLIGDLPTRMDRDEATAPRTDRAAEAAPRTGRARAPDPQPVEPPSGAISDGAAPAAATSPFPQPHQSESA